MAAVVLDFLVEGEIGRLDEGAGRPGACDLDAVDGGAEELVVGLDDAQVPADEDELLGPFAFVAEDLADSFAGGLLGFVVALGAVLLGEAFEVLLGGEVAALVGAHEGDRGEDVGVRDAPLFDDVADGGVVEGEK